MCLSKSRGPTCGMQSRAPLYPEPSPDCTPKAGTRPAWSPQLLSLLDWCPGLCVNPSLSSRWHCPLSSSPKCPEASARSPWGHESYNYQTSGVFLTCLPHIPWHALISLSARPHAACTPLAVARGALPLSSR